jgi:hypothetical protein
VVVFLKVEGLLTDERIHLLDSWQHSGFSVHNNVTVQPEDHEEVERLARYLLLCAAAHNSNYVDLSVMLSWRLAVA